jgi:hypothetical protein
METQIRQKGSSTKSYQADFVTANGQRNHSLRDNLAKLSLFQSQMFLDNA